MQLKLKLHSFFFLLTKFVDKEANSKKQEERRDGIQDIQRGSYVEKKLVYNNVPKDNQSVRVSLFCSKRLPTFS